MNTKSELVDVLCNLGFVCCGFFFLLFFHFFFFFQVGGGGGLVLQPIVLFLLPYSVWFFLVIPFYT